jgi:hypothetical protein
MVHMAASVTRLKIFFFIVIDIYTTISTKNLKLFVFIAHKYLMTNAYCVTRVGKCRLSAGRAIYFLYESLIYATSDSLLLLVMNL